MDRSAPGRRARFNGLAPLLAVVVISAGCAEFGHSQTFGRRGGSQIDCYRDDFAGRRGAIDTMSADELQAVASRCRTAASSLDRTQREIIYAYFYAGKASRLLADARGLPASADMWRDAATALEIVAAVNTPPITAKSPPAEVQFGQTWVDAKLELAKVYVRQGRYADAVARARDVITAYPAESDERHIRARFELAQVYQRQTPPDEEQAMDALRVFAQRSLDKHPYAAEARRQVFLIANKLGSEALKEGSPSSLSRAQIQFNKAREAAQAANGVDPTALPISETYVNLGRVSMQLAGVRGPDVPGGCDSRLVDFDRLNAALDFFRLAGETPVALQWAGCAHMALGNLDEAVSRFSAAALSNTASTQLSLARALSRRAQAQTGLDAARGWSEADAAYDGAVARTDRTDAPAAARTLVEAGDFYLAYLKQLGDGDARKGRLIEKAVKAFRDAKGLAPSQPVAFARLGMIALGEGDFEARRNLEGQDGARINLETARNLSSQDLETRAMTHYLLSRLEVLKFTTGKVGPTDADRRRNADLAISNADRAADLGSVDRGPAYFAQACETRLIFRRADAEGARYCVADEGRDGANYPRGLLYEGLYFLRKAKDARTIDERDTSIESAYVAFDKGASRLETIGDTTSELWSQLATGRGLALGCAGLRMVGREKITSVPLGLADRAKQLFERYDVRVCPVRR
ncbi:MAG: hypothetical protein KJS97_01710 [Alphaproteobacteria bacterium]|nr:hypothetical protein [Alphaproteobacteria bacterium]